MYPRFTKSTFSGSNGACVEICLHAGRVLIRDSKLGAESPVAAVPATRWREILDLALSRESGSVATLTITPAADGGARLDGLADDATAVRLHYTPDEWTAFIKGVADGQFDHR